MKPSEVAPPQVAPLLSHQTEDVEFITEGRRTFLANEPGTGKSRSAITATAGGRTLIVAPSMVIAGGTWSDELEKWAEDPTLYTVAPYSMLNRRKGGSPVKAVRPEYAGPWDAVIVDEAHYTKGRKTSWTWAVEHIAQSADLVCEMTGTPIPNWAHELFTILRVLFPEEAHPGGAYGSFWRWAMTWFDCSPNRFSNGNPVCGELLACNKTCLARPASDPCSHYLRFTEQNLGLRYRRVLRDDVLDLPPFTEQEVLCPMTLAQKRVYRELKQSFATTVSGASVLAWSQGALNVMLDKVTTSPWLLNKEGVPRGGKFDRLSFDLTARSAPTLVLAHYNDTVEACAEVARSVGAVTGIINGRTTTAQDADTVAAFKAGKVDVLAASLEKVAEGLQLTRADMVIFVEKSFKPYRNEQAKFRVHRLGQTRAVTSLDYVCPGSVDARKRRLIATKSDRQMRHLTAAQFMTLL
jgi:superfamily II DNA or RNA helicase